MKMISKQENNLCDFRINTPHSAGRKMKLNLYTKRYASNIFIKINIFYIEKNGFVKVSKHLATYRSENKFSGPLK